MTAVAFVVVAAVATVIRAIATSGQPRGEMPWRTLAVNATGAFLLGMVTGAGWVDNPVVIATAGLGSLTTFSTVAAETTGLIDDGHRRVAIAYVGTSLVVGVAAAWIGLSIGDAT